MNEKFEVGDTVESFGVKGVVTVVEADSYFPIHVEFETEEVEYFTPDGRFFEWAKEPSLKLVEKAKKEEPKKKYYRLLMRQNKSCAWFMSSTLVDENFRDSLGEERFPGYERKLLTDWSIEL